MHNTIRIAPPNSLLFVSDVDGGIPPEITRRGRLWTTSSCIAVGCLAFMVGVTEVSLGLARVVDPGGVPAFDGVLETPHRAVMVSTAEGEKVLDAGVSGKSTRVRIWTNHPTEPDRVIVGLG
ncbi:MAG: hypothetical protein ACREIM_01595 [Nitrospiraceae bacterium]